MSFYSPLRYPGGKSKLVPLIKLLIAKSEREGSTYIEPFAGGAGVALALLLDGTVDRIVINDYDKAIYSIWKAIKTEPYELIKLVGKTPINIEQWHIQQSIYSSPKKYSLELAFATLFLNRVNRSGIITGGPIGGYSQSGEWKLCARFNKETIIERINDIAKRRNSIIVYNQDFINLADKYLAQFGCDAFIYFDPPYYHKAKKLYKNSLSHDDHKKIADRILNRMKCPWVLTYDDVPEIRELYSGTQIKQFDLTYSAANKGKASEIMVCSDTAMYPSTNEMLAAKINLNIR